MSKQRLVFDTTDAQSLADSDKVGSYVYGADGTLITRTNQSGKDGLDVYVINPSIVVTANNLDIRDLVAATDSVSAWLKDGAGTSITSTGGALDVNLKTPLTVDVQLSHLNDSVLVGDGTDFLAINADGSINIGNTVTTSDAALANTAISSAQNALDVADTAEDAVASPLANRKYLFLQNIGNKNVFIGASGVTAANGYPLSPGGEIMLRAGAAVDIEFVGQSGVSGASAKVASLQLS